MSAIEPERPSPEALLEDAQRAKRGKLKIFLGAAPGVGKTYEMLLAARRKQTDGIDVAIGVVETHGRTETQALLDGLETLPRRSIDYKGRTLAEMDLDAILKRRPALVLVDELAHTNAEGSRHPKRYQDVEELRDNGIDVWSTLNIQHLESLNDVVARITRVRIRETVPDSVFDTADDVEVVDLTPDELIQRLKEGRVYAETQAQRALENYFKPGNLTALRELALRRTAERVDEQMRQYMKSHAIRDIWAAGERILVCINESPGASGLVRAAKRIADRIDAPWFAIYLETARTHQLGETERDRVAATLRLAEQLGAGTFTLPGSRRIADDILGFARDNNITQLVVGKSARPWWFEFLHGSVVHELVKRPSGINVHVLAELREAAAPEAAAEREAAPGAERLWRPARRMPERALGYFYSAAMVGAATLFGRAVLALVDLPNISIVFLAAVLWSAARYGLRPSLFTSLLSTFCYSFFFAQPLYSFNFSDPSEVLALVFFCIAGALTSTLTARERTQAAIAGEQAKATAELYAFSRKLAGLRKLDTLMATTAAQIAGMLKVDALVLLPDASGAALKLAASSPEGAKLDAADLAAATWAWAHNQPTGRGTDTLPGTRRLFLPLRSGAGKLGVIGVSRDTQNFLLSPPERRMLDALADLAAIATERIRLAKDIDQARMLAETGKLRATLLTSISQELRAPLASIIGTLASLRSEGVRREELLDSAQNDAERLNRSIANLLDMSQLDAGTLVPQKDPCQLPEIVDAAVARCARQLAGHRLKIAIPPGLPPLLLDAGLLEKVLVNLLDNAARYTRPGTPIEIAASRHRFSLVISVRDEGPGVPQEDPAQIFDRFFRSREAGERAGASSGASSGTGLGLAICRGLIEAMGGRIYARNRSDTAGAEFIIEFSPEVLAEPPQAAETGKASAAA